MGKVKIKKNDIWIDMTPMSDVMVLLLCFFMLTSNTHSLLNRQSGHIRLTENDTIIAKIRT